MAIKLNKIIWDNDFQKLEKKVEQGCDPRKNGIKQGEPSMISRLSNFMYGAKAPPQTAKQGQSFQSKVGLVSLRREDRDSSSSRTKQLEW